MNITLGPGWGSDAKTPIGINIKDNILINIFIVPIFLCTAQNFSIALPEPLIPTGCPPRGRNSLQGYGAQSKKA